MKKVGEISEAQCCWYAKVFLKQLFKMLTEEHEITDTFRKRGILTKSREAISYKTRMAVPKSLSFECLKQISRRFPGARGWPRRNDTLVTGPFCFVSWAYSNQHSPTIAHKKRCLVMKHRHKTKQTSYGMTTTRNNTSRNKRDRYKY